MLKECGLQLNQQKTKIVYCKDSNRKGRGKHEKFDFLGFEFRPRRVQNSKNGSIFVSFAPAISPKALRSIREKVRSWMLTKRTSMTLADIARDINPVVRGWLNYFGSFSRSSLKSIRQYIDRRLAAWAMRKFKSLHRRLRKTMRWLTQIKEENRQLFAHWV